MSTGAAIRIQVRAEGEQVWIDIDRRCYMLIGIEEARELARALLASAARADEVRHAERIANDAALLLRAGIPLGLSSAPQIVARAAHLAAWDRSLRRALPGGVKSAAVVGVPTVRGT